MNSWFRSWHGAPTDSKWLVIARKANATPGLVSAVVWALLDFASCNDPRGSISGFDVETYAAFSGWDEVVIEAVIAALKDKGVIGPDGGFHNWDKRQPKREDNSTERSRAFRAKQKQNERDETQCNATQRTGTLDKIREDTDTDKKEDDPAARVRHPRAYAFEAGVIRLTEMDLARWVKSFDAINVEAELYSLADWAGKQSSWFNAVAGALAKKDRDTRDRVERIKAEAVAGAGKPRRGSGVIP